MFNLGLLNTKIHAKSTATADGRRLDGNELVQAPKTSLNAIVRYTLPLATAGGLTFQLDGRWQSGSFAGIENDPAKKIDSYGVLNGRVGWRSASRAYRVEFFVDNLLNKLYFQNYTAATPSTFTTTITVASPSLDAGLKVPGRPRLWGVRASYDF